MKTVAIMQPYFFPYIGYFSLIHYADFFVLFDTVQYDRKGWMHRNRILKPGRGWQYFNAGVKKPPYKAAIKDVQLLKEDKWKQKICRQLWHYKNRAPYFDSVMTWLKSVLLPSFETLVQFNYHTLAGISNYIGIDFNCRAFSEMGLKIAPVEHSGQWTLRISEALNAAEYVNPPGGRDIYRVEEFESLGIKLSFLEHKLPRYEQFGNGFEPALSIIDIMMFKSPSQIRNMLNNYEIS